MKLSLMRAVDFWAGVPLTFLSTGLVRILDLLRPSAKRENVQNVLFIELSEMGSAILADASLKKVARQYNAYFVIFKKNAVSLQLLKTIPPERVCHIREDSFLNLCFDTVRFLFWCRKNKIHASIDLELFSRFTALLSVLSGAFFRVGYVIPNGEGLYRGGILTHGVSYNSHLHISKNFISLVEPLFADLQNSHYVKRVVSDQEAQFPQAVPEPASVQRLKASIQNVYPSYREDKEIVLINVNAGDLLPQRRWATQSFTQLAKKILQEFPDVLILLTGSRSERLYVDQVASALQSPHCVNFAGHVIFEDLPALYSMSKLIVTNDSGPAHFASAVGLKTFVLFGPETPLLYGPLRNTVSITAGLACSPCVTASNHRNTACRDNVCMKSITSDFVFSLVSETLRTKKYVESGFRIEVCT